MLNTSFRAETLGYDLELRRCADWKQSNERLLIILQTVETEDLKAGRLASTPTLVNCIKYARQEARQWGSVPEFAYAVINFNDRKHLHTGGSARRNAEDEFRARCQSLIAKLNPTRILISGNLNILYPLDHAEYKNGWVHEFDKRMVTSTLDLNDLTEKDGHQANLLGFWCRDLANLMLGKVPYSVKGLVNKPIYVGTIERFDKMLKLFDRSELIALDTETRNLAITSNKIYTIQLCFDVKPNHGFVIPVDHPKTPFTRDERKYIKSELRKQLNRKDNYFIMFNGMFDLRVLRACLNIPIIRAPVWEITAGEHHLDENVSSLPALGILGGNLRATLCRYENDHYFRSAFGKEDRSSTGSREPNDPEFLEYASMDVVSLHAIRAQQLRRAAKIRLQDKEFTPYFERHMRYQMSDTAHQLSHLRQDGSLISTQYLRSLMAEGSVLHQEIDKQLRELFNHPALITANKELLGASGMRGKSLFGGSAVQWVFNFGKREHKAKLFFEVLNLPAVGKTKSGADAIDKDYIEHYKDKSLVVAMYGSYQEAAKLLSTYVRGWYKRIRTDLDASFDSCLRPDYSFWDVVTGRLASKNPNLQNIPARGKLSKIIKAMFRAPRGHILIRYDYSAHEVRVWAIVAGDLVLAAAFRLGQKLRQLWIKNPTEENKAAIKKDGDLHIANVKRFFGKLVDKSHPLRDAVKSVVFGLIYGKAAKTLGEDTKKTDIQVIRAELNALYKEKRELEAQIGA